jgi:hypothetical protein
MPGQAHAHGRTHEHNHDKAIRGNFLSPGVAVVEHVTREKLQEHAQRHEPEHGERDPVLNGVVAQMHIRNGGLIESLGQFVGLNLRVNFCWTGNRCGHDGFLLELIRRDQLKRAPKGGDNLFFALSPSPYGESEDTHLSIS